MLKYREAQAKALAAGATQARIDQYAGSYSSPTVKRNMIVALHLFPWRNGPDDWARLAGALKRQPKKG
jgi:hypothetical protein